MQLVFGPGLLIATAGAVLGSVVAPLASGRVAALFGSWIVWAVVFSTVAAVITAFELPRTLVNGPIGATFVRLGIAIVVPYVALGAWLVPRLCDYS